ncbi:hypothetical protein ACFVZD_35010 [Streptomyces sp. NPDC058287]|uniref:hypothetical protein n=1 Tax=unclassified Streptomyces TaxID=2593676 RepID=UPI0036F010EC
MTDSPPRPDEDLARFHNGDTLDNIPIVKLPAPEGMSRRRQTFLWCSGVLSVVLLGAVLGVGAVRWSEEHVPAADADAPSDPTVKAEGRQLPTKATPSATPQAADLPPSAEATEQTQLEQVQIIQAPATGGDPSTTYCLVYTGSDSGSTRDTILLSDAPAYQCNDLLPYDPEGKGAWSTMAPDCTSPARPAVLSFTDATEWAGAVYFTCLTKHSGA